MKGTFGGGIVKRCPKRHVTEWIEYSRRKSSTKELQWRVLACCISSCIFQVALETRDPLHDMMHERPDLHRPATQSNRSLKVPLMHVLSGVVATYGFLYSRFEYWRAC